MEKTYVFEGKTTNEAIENGLKELKVSKNKVDIKVLETEEKRSFFNILTPRVVKVEMTLKENVKEETKSSKAENNISKSEKKQEVSEEKIKERAESLESFLKQFIENLPKNDDLNYKIDIDGNNIIINISGEDTGYLIGYRGEVLNSLQNVLTNIANKDVDSKIKVMLNIGGYREKRKKDLENLADKIARNVVKTKRSITIEPMSAYERKIIHLRLQDNENVYTHSVGEEPYRKIIVSYKK